MGHTQLTLSLEVIALIGMKSFRSNYPSVWIDTGECQRARINSGPSFLIGIKPSQRRKVSSWNELCRCHHCTNIPTTQHAYWLQIVSERTCAHVMYLCMLTQAHLFSSKEQGNRLTLLLIRKLMHRKSRQRHCSPSARSAGENNLHITRLMDTFIGREKGDWAGEGENNREQRRVGL